MCAGGREGMCVRVYERVCVGVKVADRSDRRQGFTYYMTTCRDLFIFSLVLIFSIYIAGSPMTHD